MKRSKRDKGTFIRLSVAELEILQTLKKKHFMNVSAYFRKSIQDLYEKLEKNNENNF